MDRKDEAVKIFNNGFNCSQAVLSVFSKELGLDKDIALKITTGFGSGLRKGEVCGAVSGAVMVIGLKKGHHIAGDNEAKDKTNFLTNEFTRRFEEKHGSIICKKVLGYDLSVKSELEIIKEKKLFNNICPKLIIDAIAILEDMLYN